MYEVTVSFCAHNFFIWILFGIFASKYSRNQLNGNKEIFREKAPALSTINDNDINCMCTFMFIFGYRKFWLCRLVGDIGPYNRLVWILTVSFFYMVSLYALL